MTTTHDPCYMPAVEMAAAIRRRALSPVEVVDALLARIERVNPALNAFTVVLAEQARASARQAEEAVLRGEATGILHGVPFTIKDLTFTKGVTTARGSVAFKDFVPGENGLLVERLLGAGGIFLAKTTSPEFGNKGVTESLLHGTTNNPWNTAYTTGGSSGGAAAQVAAGMGPLAHGSDGGGSIRIPASCCGVFGLKPSYGRVASFPPSSFATLSHQGPLARTVADAALMLTAMAGPDDRDPYSLQESGVDYLAALEGASVKGLRVAYSRDLGLGPVDPQVTAATDTAARLFAETLGAQVEEATPDVPAMREAFLTLWSAQMGAVTADLLLPRVGREQIDPSILNLAERAERLTAVDYHRALVLRGEHYRAMLAFFERFDLLISPVLAVPPFPHPGQAPGPETVAGQPIDRLSGWLLTFPFNLTGQPAASVPCGVSDEGLPIGLQIAGRPRADAAVLRAAAAYEQAAPWAQQRPALD